MSCDTETPTLSAAEVCAALNIGHTKLHRLGTLIGYEHQGSGNHTRYLAADIEVFRAILALREFATGGDVTRGAALPPEMQVALGTGYAETGRASVSHTIGWLQVTITVEDIF